jgi:cytochrome c-type biogenesis protein CcmH/NrfG
MKRYNTSYNLRSNLANTLFDRGRYGEALPHLEWCHRRAPDNESIAQRIETSIERQDQTEMAAEPNERELFR